jgi:hypothetical protein
MKKIYKKTFLLLMSGLILTSLNAQNEYFREGFEAANTWGSTGTNPTPGYVTEPSGQWYFKGVTRTTGGTSNNCSDIITTIGINHLRLRGCDGTDCADSGFVVTPQLNFGIGQLRFVNGRASRRYTIYKSADASAETTNWTLVEHLPTTTARCALFTTVEVNDPLAKRLRIVTRGGTDTDLDSIIITSTSPILPVRLLSFDAINRTNGIEVMWKADNETEGKSYSVERSNNGVAFEEINKVETIGAGTYSFLDKTAKLGPVAYYRLQMTSVDGEKTYSKIMAVVLNGTNTLSISPNPVRGNSLNATFKPFTEPTTVRILNTSGKVLLTQQIAPFVSQSAINTSGLSKGLYMIQFVNGTEVKTSRFLKD